jgi:(p)ppGpp synthase/HD superfamily hydrolase
VPTSARYADALSWAATLHAAQLRKGTGHPYVAHLLSVSAMVWRDGGSEDEAIAGLLHDAIEDQGVTKDEVASRYGERVAHIVELCTDAEGSPKPPWRARKEAHLTKLRAVHDEDVLRVVAADKVDNAISVIADHDTMGARIWDIFTGGREGTAWYYGAMHELLAANAPQLQLVQRLAALSAELRDRAESDA